MVSCLLASASLLGYFGRGLMVLGGSHRCRGASLLRGSLLVRGVVVPVPCAGMAVLAVGIAAIAMVTEGIAVTAMVAVGIAVMAV